MEAYSLAQKDALLNLYRVEIEQRLQYLDETKAAPLLQLMPKERLEKLREDESNLNALGEQLWFELTTSPLKACLYDALLQYFSDAGDNALHRVLTCDSRRSHFNVVLANLDEFLQHLDCEKCLEYLKTIDHYVREIASMEEAFKEIVDITHGKSMILRTIAPFGTYGVYDILFSIYSCSNEGATFVERIFPNFVRFYKLVDKERKDPRGQVRLWAADSDLSTFLTQSSAEKQSTIIDLNYDDFSNKGDRKVLLSAIDNKMYKERPINLREYQKELCEEATEGRNCIVCAPTGSGKTIVAAYIIKEHLMKAAENGKPGKVLFMICNTAIIGQQREQIEQFVSHRFEVDAISGEDNRPIRQLIYAKDVVVCTPQMIVNLLDNNSRGDGFESSSRPFSIDDFSLIIFDECHNTKKDTPYSNIMRHYHRKMTCNLLTRPPQIVGLTASLGVGKDAKDQLKALKHIIGLCALLDTPTISLVRKNAAELMQFSPPTADEFKDCSMEDGHDEDRVKFHSLLLDFMKKLELKMNQLLRKEDVPIIAPIHVIDEERPIVRYKSITSPPVDQSSEEYCSWIAEHLNTIIPESKLEPNTKRQATEILQCLMILYRSLELFFNFTSKDSYNYMVEKFADLTNHLSRPISQLFETYKPQLEKLISEHCSLINAVEKLILEQDAKAPDSRSIVFVKTRRGTRVLTDLLNNRSGLKTAGISTEALSGHNKTTNSRDIDQKSRREQAETLDRFRSAATRVLVSTSVAEEGLDIAQCSLVIKYNYSTNEIAHVQRRGRGRAAGSRCVLVTNQSKIEKQEQGNIMKERLMKQAIACIENQEIDLAASVAKEIVKLRETIIQNDKEKEEKIEEQRAQGVQYDILCRKCEMFLCTNGEIKIEKTHYMVCNPDFWEKCTPRQIPVENQKRYSGAATLICNEEMCGNELGIVVRIEDTNMPVLQAAKIVLRLVKDDTRKAVKQWKEILGYFYVEQIRPFDLALMKEHSPLHLSNIQFSGVDN